MRVAKRVARRPLLRDERNFRRARARARLARSGISLHFKTTPARSSDKLRLRKLELRKRRQGRCGRRYRPRPSPLSSIQCARSGRPPAAHDEQVGLSVLLEARPQQSPPLTSSFRLSSSLRTQSSPACCPLAWPTICTYLKRDKAAAAGFYTCAA